MTAGLEVPAATDTSRWEASLSFAGRETGFAPPAARMGPAVCFDSEPPEGLPEGTLELPLD